MEGAPKRIARTAAPGQNNAKPPSFINLYLALSLIALAVLAAGYFIYGAQERSIRSKVEREISTIAQLKAAEITRWRSERLAYADTLSGNAFYPNWVTQWKASPTAELESTLRSRLASEAKRYSYGDLLVVDARGEVLLSFNNSVKQLSAVPVKLLDEASRDHKPVMTDFYIQPDSNQPHIDIIAPLFSGQEDKGLLVGAVVLCIDPSLYLYPLVQSWPLPSNTAEIELVEKDGDSAIFLNNLRFQPDSALKLRVPLTRMETAAVMAVTGSEGVVEGTDYRGTHVLAALRQVQDSPWYVVAKIDTNEALADWQWQSGLIIAIFITLLAAALAVIGLFWQRRQRIAYQALYKAEETIREAAETYRNLFLNSQIGLFRTDIRTGMLLDANDAVARFVGYRDRASLLAKPFSIAERYTDPQDRERMISLLQSHGEFQNYDAPFMRNDGSIILMRFSGRLVRDKGWIEGVSEDITERKRVEEALKESEERFRNMANLLPQTIFETDEKSNFVFVNRQGFEMFGYNEADIARGMSVLETIIPQDRERAVENISLRIQGKESPPQEYTAVRKDGSTFPVTIYAAPIIIDSKYAGMRGMLIDITENKRAEEALRGSEEKYRMVVENAQEGILIAVDGMFKFINHGATLITGYSQEEAISRPFIEFVHPDDRDTVIDRHLRRMKGEYVSNIFSFRLISKSGDIKWVELAATLVAWEGKPATLNFITDITDRKRLDEERQRVAKLESVGVLAGGIAHDFNNILTSILGNISLARMEAAPASGIRESLEQAEKASLRAKHLTQQLLTFSRGGAPVTKLASLTELLNDTAGFALRGSNVNYRYSIPDDLWHAEIDEGQVSQVIHNLVINARQSMPAGGTIDLLAENIALSEKQNLGKGLPLKEGNYIRIAVSDHGSGIAAGQLDRIFDPFFTTKQTGSGLGLATSFSIARQHGGHISVESEVGTGSTFYLYLPASLERATPARSGEVAFKPVEKAKILVMDDEQGIREVAGRLLRHIGYQDIEFAADGAKAIKLYKEAMKSDHPFNAVILDLTIPGGMGGTETIEKLLKIDPGVRAILSSGYVDDSVIAKYKDYGFCGMAAKPYTLEELGKALYTVLN